MAPFYTDEQITPHHGDALQVLSTLPAGSVDCCVTSPPYYGLRDYGEPGQYGLEPSPAAYVETMRAVFAQVRRVLADDGTCWLNLGDSYSGYHGNSRVADDQAPSNKPGYWENMRGSLPGGVPPKNLIGVPWRVAFALQDDGWILRNAVIWDKPNAMPESVTDRLSTTYELVFLLAKSRRYWFDLDAIKVPLISTPEEYQSAAASVRMNHRLGTVNGTPVNRTSFLGTPTAKNPGDVWTLPTQPFPEAHFAVMAPELARRCIVAGCKPGGVVLDPFAGSGTTGMVALRHGRRFVGIDLSADYLNLALRTRLAQTAILDEVAS